MGRPSQLANPVTIAAMGAVPVVRGLGYIIADLMPNRPFTGGDVGPYITFFPLWTMGVMWICIGLAMWASMWVWSWFKRTAALAVGAYITWSILYVMDLLVSPTIMTMTSLAGYLCSIAVIITLVGIELDRDYYREANKTDPDLSRPSRLGK